MIEQGKCVMQQKVILLDIYQVKKFVKSYIILALKNIYAIFLGKIFQMN